MGSIAKKCPKLLVPIYSSNWYAWVGLGIRSKVSLLFYILIFKFVKVNEGFITCIAVHAG